MSGSFWRIFMASACLEMSHIFTSVQGGQFFLLQGSYR